MTSLRKLIDKKYISYYMIPVVYLVIQGLRLVGLMDNYVYFLIMLAMINGIMTISLNLVNGITGQFSIAQAGFMSVGGYTSAILTTVTFGGLQPGTVPGMVMFLFSLLIGGLVSAVIGFLIGIPSLRLRGDYLAIITLGFSEMIRILWRVIPVGGGAKGLIGIKPYASFTLIFIIVILTMFLLRNFTTSNFGRASLAVRENELAAETMGLNTTKFKVTTFVMSAFIAGVGGGLFAHYIGFLNPNMFSYMKSMEFLLFLYAGGVGSYTSAFLGAILFTSLPEALRFMGEWRMVLYAFLLVLIMIRRPQGIFGGVEFGFMRFGEKAPLNGFSSDNILRQKLAGMLSRRKDSE